MFCIWKNIYKPVETPVFGIWPGALELEVKQHKDYSDILKYRAMGDKDRERVKIRPDLLTEFRFGIGDS